MKMVKGLKKANKVNFKFNLGDEVKDVITGFSGIITSRTQWLNNCNTYGVQPTRLKDGVPGERQHFDEPQLEIVVEKVFQESRATGGPSRPVPNTNR